MILPLPKPFESSGDSRRSTPLCTRLPECPFQFREALLNILPDSLVFSSKQLRDRDLKDCLVSKGDS
jgi:hypothetical protein